MKYEEIMRRMLERVPSNLDKREGSIIWDALAPAALELEILYIELERFFRNSFADTADYESLVRLAKERGIAPYGATAAILRVASNMPMAKGARLRSAGGLMYRTIEESIYQDPHYLTRARCETTGTQGNLLSGEMVAEDRVPGLTDINVVAIEVPGQDAETLEAFRERYLEEVKRNNFGGNIEDYVRWVTALEGVGACKVFPVWDGGGTVKVVLVDTEYAKPTTTLIEQVQESLDPVPHNGKGVGIAPIGHTVTVVGAEEDPIRVEMILQFAPGYNWEKAKAGIESHIREYIKEEAKHWGKRPVILRSSHIISRLIEEDYILDVSRVSIKGRSSAETTPDVCSPAETRYIVGDAYIPILSEVVEVSNG